MPTYRCIAHLSSTYYEFEMDAADRGEAEKKSRGIAKNSLKSDGYSDFAVNRMMETVNVEVAERE